MKKIKGLIFSVLLGMSFLLPTTAHASNNDIATYCTATMDEVYQSYESQTGVNGLINNMFDSLGNAFKESLDSCAKQLSNVLKIKNSFKLPSISAILGQVESQVMGILDQYCAEGISKIHARVKSVDQIIGNINRNINNSTNIDNLFRTKVK